MFSRLAKHLSVLVVMLAAFVAASCGVGAGESSDGVQLRVTSDFGKNVIADETDLKTSGEETVMRLLQRNVDGVKTRFGGGRIVFDLRDEDAARVLEAQLLGQIAG